MFGKIWEKATKAGSKTKQKLNLKWSVNKNKQSKNQGRPWALWSSAASSRRRQPSGRLSVERINIRFFDDTKAHNDEDADFQVNLEHSVKAFIWEHRLWWGGCEIFFLHQASVCLLEQENCELERQVFFINIQCPDISLSTSNVQIFLYQHPMSWYW